jgi:glycosyltransferase involved in cell wall biosynthesis
MKSPLSKLKIALAHDYLREYGGAERVVEALHRVFPQAPLYTTFVDRAVLGVHADKFAGWDIRESWLTHIPFYKKLYSPLRIFAPEYFRSFNLSEYDVVISSSNAYMAKAVRVRPGSLHLCYCHTPPRALYGYATMSNWRSNPFIRVVGEIINHYLRIRDWYIAQEVGVFIANSLETQKRISKFYRRDSVIIHPPVQVSETPPTKSKREYYLYVNRLALAKHPEIAVKVATAENLALVVVGAGPMLEGLKEMAGPTVTFAGAVSDEQLHELYAGAKALLYPVEDEDFGIVPIEALGHGVPVIAHASGGPLETIQDGKTGVLFSELSEAGLAAAIKKADKITFSPKILWSAARSYSEAEFKKKLLRLITTELGR